MRKLAYLSPEMLVARIDAHVLMHNVSGGSDNVNGDPTPDSDDKDNRGRSRGDSFDDDEFWEEDEEEVIRHGLW